MTKRVVPQNQLPEESQEQIFEKIKTDNPVIYAAVEKFYPEHSGEIPEIAILCTLAVVELMDKKSVGAHNVALYSAAMVVLGAEVNIVFEDDDGNITEKERAEKYVTALAGGLVGAGVGTALGAIGITGLGGFALGGGITGAVVELASQGYKLFIDPYEYSTIDDRGRFIAKTVLNFDSYFSYHWSDLAEHNEWELTSEKSPAKIIYDKESGVNGTYSFSTAQVDENTFFEILDHEGSKFEVVWDDDGVPTSDTVINFYNYTDQELLSAALSTDASNADLAKQALLALVSFTPFVLEGEQESQYTDLNIADYSETYLKDRALYMYNYCQLRYDDHLAVSTENVAATSFTDMKQAEKYLLKAGSGSDRRIVWGNDLDNQLEIVGSQYFNGDNHLYGEGGDDTIIGKFGNDYLEGGDGNDTIEGGDGVDTIHGGNDDDDISGGDKVDHLYGDAGHDYITGDEGNDIIYGGADDDILYGDSFDGSGAGFDDIYGEQGNDLLLGGDGWDNLYGGDDNDILHGGAGEDQLDGGTGVDTASYEFSNTGVEVNISTGEAYDGDANGDTFISIENLTGSKFDDTLTGTGNGSILTGLNGDDTYTVIHVDDQIIEAEHGGSDTIKAAVSHTLLDDQHVETLILLDDDELVEDKNMDATGNNLDNRIEGNSGYNSLKGMAGDDILLEPGGAMITEPGAADFLPGGAGNDILVVADSMAGLQVELEYIDGYWNKQVLDGGSGDDDLLAEPLFGVDREIIYGRGYGNDILFNIGGSMSSDGEDGTRISLEGLNRDEVGWC